MTNTNVIKLNLSGHFNADLESKGFVFPGIIQMDINKPVKETLQAITEYLKEQGVSSGTVVHIVPAGMSTLATLQLVAIHALTGHFPFLTTLIRNEKGEFVVKEHGVDLTTLRNELRINRENIKIL